MNINPIHGNSVSVWSRGEDCQAYQVCPLKLFCDQIYVDLKKSLPPEFSFPARITISTSDYKNIEPIILNKNAIIEGLITDFCNNTLLINQLTTGSNVLEILDALLEKNDFYLQISFSRPLAKVS